MLDRKVPLRLSQPTEMINFAKEHFTERNGVGSPESTCFPQLRSRWRKIKPKLLLTSFPERCQLGGLNPAVSQKHRCGEGGANPPQPHEAVVLPLWHCWWPILMALLPQHPKFGGTGNRSGQTFFIKLTSPGMLLSSAAGSARQEYSEAGVQAGALAATCHVPVPHPLAFVPY